MPFLLQKKTVAALIFALSCGSGLAHSQTAYNDPWWASPNANTSFVDQFNDVRIDRNKWQVVENIFVNGEDIDYQDVEYPAADWSFRVGQPDPGASDGRVLNLKARYMDGQIQDYYGGNSGQGKPLFIRAGRIESQIADDSTFVYGKFEARIKMPPARNGEFPAWWLLGNFPDVGWTACSELDIIEFTGADPTRPPQTRWQAPYVAYGGNPFGTTYAQLGINPSDQYVTYGVIKTPESIEFYINGIRTFAWTKAERGDQPFPYLSPMRMILNHAITHVEWPAVGNYNRFSTDANVANKTGYTRTTNGVTEYEYIDIAAMNNNIGRNGTDFLVDYVAHWPLPTTDSWHKYIDESKYSFFRPTNNTKGFYSLKGWMAPVSVTADAYLQEGDNAYRDNSAKNAADGYVGSKWATPRDDNMHSVTIDYGVDKPIKYFWIEWSWNLPKSYDIYGKTSSGNWEHILTSTQENTGWSTHTFDVNKTYRYIKLVTKGRINKSEPIWLLEFKAFEDVANVYPKPAGTVQVDRSVNVLGNGAFNDGLAGWQGENYDGSGAAYSVVNGEARITAAAQGTGSGSYQLHTQGFGLKRNYRYQISFRARAESPRNIQVRLSENQLNPSSAETYLLQNVALGTAMANYSFNVDFTGSDNAGRLALLFGNMGNATTFIDDVVIREIAYIGSGDPLVPAISAANFVGASAGWESEWWGVAARAVDASTGTQASGRPGLADNQDLWVSVNIEPDFEVKEVLVAGDKSAPRSLAQFRVEYGTANNTMIDWTNSNIGGNYETFTAFSANPPANERNFRFWFRPPAGQVVEVSDIQLMAVDLKPHRIHAINLDGVGSISPGGTTRYSKNNTDSVTYTFVPPAGRQVANVIVDGVSQGALNSYTFNAISASHTIAVSFTGANVASSALSSALGSSSSVASSVFRSSSSDVSSAVRSSTPAESSAPRSSSPATSSTPGSSSVASSVVRSSTPAVSSVPRSSSSVASTVVRSSTSSVVSSSVASSAARSSVSSAVNVPAGSYGHTVNSKDSVTFYFANAPWVDVHYTVNGRSPMNVRMLRNTTTGMNSFTANNLSPGANIEYSFTVGRTTGGAYEVRPSSFLLAAYGYSRPTPITDVQPATVPVVFYTTDSPWSDLHYKINNGPDMNVRMVRDANNTNTFTVLAPYGATITYSFTIGRAVGGAMDTSRASMVNVGRQE